LIEAGELAAGEDRLDNLQLVEYFEHGCGLEFYLAHAAIDLERPLIGGGGHPDKMTLILHGGVAVAAKAGGDQMQLKRAKREVAAWVLACELGLRGLVPATTLRSMPTTRGSDVLVSGSAQVLWPQFKTARVAEIGFDDCPHEATWQIALFDSLCANTDRHEHNWGIMWELPHVVLIDHGHAFGDPVTDSGFAQKHAGQTLPPELLRRLALFVAEPEESRLRGLLSERELTSVFSRAQRVLQDELLVV
jgi:hypothetical protein